MASACIQKMALKTESFFNEELTLHMCEEERLCVKIPQPSAEIERECLPKNILRSECSPSELAIYLFVVGCF